MLARPFVHDGFLLEGRLAAELHEEIRHLPLIDYHGHLSPELLARDHRFATLTEAWLAGDHYKWRALRANGIPEALITGETTDLEKFLAWARTVPMTLGNPLYHWTHMELAFPFGLRDKLLDPSSAREIYETCNARLREERFSVTGLLEQWKVAVVCTTDDPADSLAHHEALARRPSPATRVYPTWRPDRALGVEDAPAFRAWVDRLEASAGNGVGSFRSFLLALDGRHEAFAEAGCRASDHGLEAMEAMDVTERQAASVFAKARSGKPVTPLEGHRYRSFLLRYLAELDAARGFVQQFHLGALRNNNARLLLRLGADTGCDSIGDFEMARPLARFLGGLDAAGKLAKTVIYNLNPRDNELFAAMAGCFQDGSSPGKIQHGPAWWFLDQKDGIESQMRGLANMGLLSLFIGMTTDSRSFLSFSRHDYFRRILCSFVGSQVEKGLWPDERKLLVRMLRAIAFENARDYFGFPLGRAADAA
ncbi:MAG TPA: glucuronate isomerase [Vicinamibacteria bacterium]